VVAVPGAIELPAANVFRQYQRRWPKSPASGDALAVRLAAGFGPMSVDRPALSARPTGRRY